MYMYTNPSSAISLFILELSQAVVDAGAVPLLVLCIQEPEISLKRITASALSDISKHSPEVRGREGEGEREREREKRK